jgi:two-component system chemotaxis sensor kinase CheA
MFITAKRHEREKQALLGASNRLTEAVLAHSEQGLFLIDGTGTIQPQVSHSLARLCRRQDFSDLTFDRLIAPLVTAKNGAAAKNYVAGLIGSLPRPDPQGPNPLKDVDVRLVNPDGSSEVAHYSFEFHPIDAEGEARLWLVRVTDITQQAQMSRELEELRVQAQMQGEILRGVLHMGGARFGAFLQRTEASMKTINSILKKPAREEEAFRHKLEEALEEVDRVRRDAAAFKLSALEGAARLFEDSLHDLRSRKSLSGSEFLPLAVKLDQLYGQFASLKSLTQSAAPARGSEAQPQAAGMTENGTQIIQAPKFLPPKADPKPLPGAQRSAPAGSLESTLRSLTDHIAQEYNKTVTLDCQGLQLVPQVYQSVIKNVAIQLIRNSVMHGIETPAERRAKGKLPDGLLRLEFKLLSESGFELQFEDDGCGLDPDQVRATAIASGVVTAETAARLRDREAIKLIFKSGYTTLENSPGGPQHGTGMSLVRRYIHEAGGKIALASLLGHETRFKISLPPLADADAETEAGAA